jgi:hypothetical protein
MTEPDLRTPEGTVNLLAAGAGKRTGLAADPRAVCQAVLRAFATTGRPPGPTELEDAARRYGIAVGQAPSVLAAADVLGRAGQRRLPELLRWPASVGRWAASTPS